jgi:hypothetical protein
MESTAWIFPLFRNSDRLADNTKGKSRQCFKYVKEQAIDLTEILIFWGEKCS